MLDRAFDTIWLSAKVGFEFLLAVAVLARFTFYIVIDLRSMWRRLNTTEKRKGDAQ